MRWLCAVSRMLESNKFCYSSSSSSPPPPPCSSSSPPPPPSSSSPPPLVPPSSSSSCSFFLPPPLPPFLFFLLHLLLSHYCHTEQPISLHKERFECAVKGAVLDSLNMSLIQTSKGGIWTTSSARIVFVRTERESNNMQTVFIETRGANE